MCVRLYLFPIYVCESVFIVVRWCLFELFYLVPWCERIFECVCRWLLSLVLFGYSCVTVICVVADFVSFVPVFVLSMLILVS